MSILTVTTTADSGDGSLRSAIAQATSGDTIQFSKKLSGKTITLKSGQLVLDKDLTIDGSDASNLTISGNKASRVFYLNKKKTATIKNLTIANGKTKGAGGGIDTRHGSVLTLENVKLNNNTSELGGALRLGHLAKSTIIDSSFKGNDGTLTDKHKGFSAGAISHNESRGQLIIKGTTFENNKGFNGGAIYSISGVSFVVEDSVFRNNTAENRAGGGAIFTDGVSSKNYNSGLANEGKIIIRGSQFEGNRAQGEGGALFLWGYENDQAIIIDSSFVDNIAAMNAKGKAKGGAIWAKMGLTIRNVTFAGNTAIQQGGAIWFESKQPANIVNSTFSGNKVIKDAGGAVFVHTSTPFNITNSTIAYNTAGRANGGLWFGRNHNVTLKNSIVAFNTARDRRQDQVGFQVKDGGGNLEFATSSQSMRVFKNSLVTDPLLSPLTEVNGDLIHSLKAGSPAVNAGVNKGAPKTDQLGVRRDNRTDIGSFEWVAPSPDKLPTVNPSFSDTNTEPPTANSTANPIAYLSFDDGEGKVAKDSSAKGRDNFGTLIGDAEWTKGIEGVKGSAITLDGRGDAIRIKNSSDINIDKHGERTISLRFWADQTNTVDQKQVLYEEGGSTRGLNIYLDEDKLYVGGWNRTSKESGWTGTWLSTAEISVEQWHRVDLVLEGGNKISQNAIRGYLDGEEFDSGKGSQLWSHRGGIGIGSIHDGTRFHDGLTPRNGSGFAGAIDEVMIFNDALSDNEIAGFL